MKRNLSKNTAKALAVGLAVGLGSSTAVGGINNLVSVNANDMARVVAIQGDPVYDENGPTITITFAENVQVKNNNALAGFKVENAQTNDPITIDTQEVANGKVVLTLVSKLPEGANYKVIYDQANAGNSGADILHKVGDENEVVNTFETTFNVPASAVATAPVVSSAVIEDVNKNIIKVTFDKEVATAAQDISGLFTVKKDTTPVQGVTAAIDTNNSTIINITLPADAQNGETYKISYTAGTTDFITDKTNTTLKVADFTDQAVTNNVQATTPSVSIAENDEITAEGFKFKVLADTTKVALIGREITPIRANHTGSNLNKGTIEVNGNTLIITQIGDGSALTGSFSIDELNKLCAEATIIKAKAFDGVAVTGATEISLPKVTEVEANSLAFKSGIATVKLPAVKDANKIAISAFKSATQNQKSTVQTLVVDDSIKTQVINKLGNNSGITSVNGTTIKTETTTTKPGSSSSSGSGAVINSAGQLETTTVEGSTETTTQYVTKNLSLDKVSLPEISEASKSFADVVASHWASSAISRLASAGIINGMPDGSFNLNGNTKRADMAVMLIRLLGLNETFSGNFSDVPENAYYANAVGLAREYGIVTGSTDGRFNPNANISRQDTMVMIARILQNLNISVNSDTSVLAKFSDNANISAYAVEGTAILVNAGVVNGSNGKINPKAPITRAEIAVIMDKLYDIIDAGKKANVETTTETTSETTTKGTSSESSTETTTSESTTETTTTK